MSPSHNQKAANEGSRLRINERRWFYAQCRVNLGNSLPLDDTDAKIVHRFKKRPGKFTEVSIRG